MDFDVWNSERGTIAELAVVRRRQLG